MKLSLFGLHWDFYDWSLSRESRPNWLLQMFSLKCGSCRCWSWGCAGHWFCGCCEPCRILLEGGAQEER